MGSVVTLFAVLDREGRLRRNRHRSPMIYEKQSTAQNQARREGDSVVQLDLDLGREPLFIREKKQ